MPPSRWASIDYALDWPHELLHDEILALREDPYWPWRPEDVAVLLREAFHTEVPAMDFERISSADLWMADVAVPDGAARQPLDGQVWVQTLLDHLDEVRRYAPPPPLWRVRQAFAGLRDEPDPENPREAFRDLITQLNGNGYLARRFPPDCHDDEVDEHGERRYEGSPPEDRIRRYVNQLTGHSGRELWPPILWERWSNETFYELIEALHDVVARPRRRWFHEDPIECGWHFEDFDTEAGRRIYRALVNRLLAERGVELRLAETGEDEGRLVRVVDDARAELVEHALATPDPDARGRVKHAVTLFRRRDATEHDKRSAIVTLALVLEERRQLLKASLFTKDEGALFRIANEFDVRHRDEKQHPDYDPAFRDWVFWWYLATIELTNGLLDRQVDAEESA